MEDYEVSANADRWYVDTYTGEIREVRPEPIYLQPIDIEAITSREIFEGVVKERRKLLWKLKLSISPIMLDVVIEKRLSIPAISILCLLGQMIGYNNMVYTTVKVICTGSGYTRQTVSLALTELKGAGFLREVEHKLREKESRFLLINPLYFFLGWYPHRNNFIIDWMKVSTLLVKHLA